MGNNAFAAVIGISTCKLDLRGGHTLYLHDLLYTPEVRRNLVFLLALLQLGFNFFYGSGFVLNVFMVLNTVNVFINDNDSIYIVQNFNTTNNSDIIT
jgi:hypothetical protein